LPVKFQIAKFTGFIQFQKIRLNFDRTIGAISRTEYNQIYSMPSIIKSYEYDIFISYRQKDNKHDGWVTEFVDNLRGELESTFKEEVSVYFDINPHDGLLETHDVDASIKDKLKCLIFIPIISRTYCDPKSFAWENEFKVFVELASQDQSGLKIKLPNSNVASRVLPIRIHDLENADIKLYESILGGVLRGIEFIYKEPGVNRPLTPYDDEKININKTRYRNQINKVALAIKEIISALKKEPVDSGISQEEIVSIVEKPVVSEKSIIVLPFENISSDTEQEYFSDGLTEEIITDLSQISDLLVISRSSAMTFKGTKKTIPEIAQKVNVRYVLEGSVRKAGSSLRITAQLIDSFTDTHIWTEKYNGILDDVFDIQEKVSWSIADALKIKLSSKEKEKIHERPIDNVFAYDCYKRAYPEMVSMSKERLEHGLALLQKGLDVTGENAVIYAGMAFGYFQYANLGIEHEGNIKKAEVFIQKALSLENNLAEALFVIGLISVINGEMVKGIDYMSRAHANKPEDAEIMGWLSLGYSLIGKIDPGKLLINKCFIIDPINPWNDSIKGWNHFFDGKFDLATNPLLAAYDLTPDSFMNQFWKSLILFYNNRADEAYDFICTSVEEPATNIWSQGTIFLKYVIKRDKDKLALLLTPDFVKVIQMDLQYSYHFATFYSYLGEKEKSLEFLENAINRGFINYPLLAEHDPYLENIRGEERFKRLIKRVKHAWEKFKV
jgi:TolB-like protein